MLLAVALNIAAQPLTSPENISYTAQARKEGGYFHITFDIVLKDHIRSQEMVILTPIFVNGDQIRQQLAPAVIAGPKRYRVIKRLLAYDNPVFEQTPQVLIKRKRSPQAVSLSYAIPYEEWMPGADLLLATDENGCVNCGNIHNQYVVTQGVLPPLFTPEYRVSYITPVAEVKERSETFIARINYVVDRYELLPNFKNNATVLREVDAVINELLNDPYLTITHHTVTGYASPEGRFNSNITLSKNRAKSFMDYLQRKYGWDTSQISHDGKGEDWEGLRKAVSETAGFAYRDEVIRIIDNTPDIARRKQRLQALDGGRVYKMMLQDLYPPLRRNEFEVSYIARAFNVDEAREIIRKRPQLLNLNEMFMVANSYPKDSKEFKEVFDIAVRMYPDNIISKINAGAMEIETNSTDRAIERLKGIETAEAWNNLGVAYIHKGNPDLARQYFERAAKAGNANATHNLDQLKKKEENQKMYQ